MEHRSYGETKNCKGCRFWSDMLAQSEAGTVTAMCINSDSPESGKYMAGWSKCTEWKSGHYGSIDSPGESEEIQDMYAQDVIDA